MPTSFSHTGNTQSIVKKAKAMKDDFDSQREIPIPNDDERWREAFAYWDRRSDRDEARNAVDIFEELADAYPDESNAWAWVARCYYWMGDSTRDKDERKRNFHEGYEAGKRGVKIDKESVPCNFWGASCLAQYSLAGNSLTKATQLPTVLEMLKVVNKRQSDYFHDGLARFLAISMAYAPKIAETALKLLGQKVTLEDLTHRLETQIQTNPNFISNYVTLAEVSKGLKKMEEARAWLEKGMAVDPDADPLLAPENELDHERLERRLNEW